VSDNLELVDRFFSAEGRLGRMPFLASALVLIVIAALYEAITGGVLQWLTGWFVYPALLYSGACLLSKRLHDRGYNGWFAALILVALVAVWPQPSGYLDFPFTLILLWAGVELGVLLGEPGPNRFGPPPSRMPL